ncbi:MAG: amino acid permease [Sphingomonadaceae bacterium]|nr:amino acid permease [Sphingomonadaceae bacterium]
MDKRPHRLLIRKPLVDVAVESERHGLVRSLGAVQLTLLGIGCIIGAGVYVMTGVAASAYAGPAVTLSFVLAAVACGFTALCYAELSSTLPVAGASYSYAYAAMGELFAWTLGWMLSLEMGLAGSALAVGVSGYFTSLLGDFGVHLPAAITTPLVQAHVGSDAGGGAVGFTIGGGINLVAVAAVAFFAVVLIRGVTHSARLNAVMVAVKVGVLVIFVAVGARHVNPANWHPFVPPSEGGFAYGWAGVLRGASILFFAYLGFEAVATAALEAKRPQRDVPIGILGALAVATLLYVAVALVLTGLVSFRRLGVPDPVAVAANAIGWPAITLLIKLGALAGLSSVLMVNTYAHSRICFAMSGDGLLPRFFCTVHPRFRTPHLGTIGVAAVAAVGAACLPISILGDLVSLGTGVVFVTVGVSVMWLRSSHPELPRPFRVPGGGVRVGGLWIGLVPTLAVLFTVLMVAPVIANIILDAARGNWIPAVILILYILVGALFYALYGLRNSRLGQGLAASAWSDNASQ